MPARDRVPRPSARCPGGGTHLVERRLRGVEQGGDAYGVALCPVEEREADDSVREEPLTVDPAGHGPVDPHGDGRRLGDVAGSIDEVVKVGDGRTQVRNVSTHPHGERAGELRAAATCCPPCSTASGRGRSRRPRAPTSRHRLDWPWLPPAGSQWRRPHAQEQPSADEDGATTTRGRSPAAAGGALQRAAAQGQVPRWTAPREGRAPSRDLHRRSRGYPLSWSRRPRTQTRWRQASPASTGRGRPAFPAGRPSGAHARGRGPSAVTRTDRIGGVRLTRRRAPAVAAYGGPLPPPGMRMGGPHFRPDAAFVAAAARDVHRLTRLADLAPTSRLLDWGCGAGRLAVGIRSVLGHVADYHGVDVQPDLIAWAQANLADQHTRFTWVDLVNARYNPGGTAARAIPTADGPVDGALRLLGLLAPAHGRRRRVPAGDRPVRSPRPDA